MSRHFIPLLTTAVLCAVCTWGGLHFTGHPFTWHAAFLLIYFPAVTFALLRWQLREVAKTNIFIRRFMGGLVLKLMGSLIVFGFLLKAAPEAVDKPLTVVFAGLYLVYLVFSTSRLSLVMRSPGK